VQKFEGSGSVADKNGKGRPALRPSQITKVDHVRKTLAAKNAYGRCSVREVSHLSHVSKSSVHKIFRHHLNLTPYKPRFVQHITEEDKTTRVEFADKMLGIFGCEMGDIFWTDEANFYLHGEVSSLSGAVWSEENPHVRMEKPLHSPKVTVWIGFNDRFISPPFFFDGNVNSQNYLAMLQTHCIPFLKRKRILSRTFFQQDGAPPHVAKVVKSYLQEVFGGGVISRDFAFRWPPRSPDLNPLDFWFWAHVKRIVYKSPVNTLPDLRIRIAMACSTIKSKILLNVVASVPERLKNVKLTGGSQL
jgi:transposase